MKAEYLGFRQDPHNKIDVELHLGYCDICGEAMDLQEIGYYHAVYCPNHRCPESPNFRKYLLGEYEPPTKWVHGKLNEWPIMGARVT